MNLNDVLAILPQTIRGRFSASNGERWLGWADLCIAKMERIQAGPHRIRRVQATQLASGFVPTPKPLVQITAAWLDDEPVTTLVEKNDKGFWMAKGAVDFEKLPVSLACATEEGASVSFTNAPTSGSIEGFRVVKILEFSDAVVTAGWATLELTSGEALPADPTDMVNYPLWINGELLHISEASYGVGNVFQFKVTESSAQVISNLDGQVLGGCPADSLAGAEVHCDRDLVGLSTSAWSIPASTPGGYTDAQLFACERDIPGRVWSSYRAGTLVKSNLVVEGYRSLARPSTMEEELDVPETSKELIAAFLRWKAEADMEPGGQEARSQEALYTQLLHDYTVDQSRTDGDSMPHSYNCTPRFSNGSF